MGVKAIVVPEPGGPEKLKLHEVETPSPGPSDVLQVCFGTGSTAGSFASYPELRSLTIVDTNPDVLLAMWW